MTTESSDVVVRAVGDALIQHRVSQLHDPAMTELRDLLADSDLTVANLEGAIQDGRDWPAFVAGQGGHGSPHMAIPPWVVDELRALGISYVFAANNHASDFGENGILTTMRYLDDAGFAYSGIGESLTAATRPAYVYTRNARIAVFSVADNGPRVRAMVPYPVPRGCFPGDSGPSFRDRPGVNFVRYEPVFHVADAVLDALKLASKELSWEYEKAMRAGGGLANLMSPSTGTTSADGVDTDQIFHFAGMKFQSDDRFYYETVPYDYDLERNYAAIATARKNADLVIVGFHQQGASWDLSAPPEHTRIFARGAIDAGADAFLAHGYNRFGGVEVYNGKPVALGLPRFISQHKQRVKVSHEQIERVGLNPSTASVGDLLSLYTGRIGGVQGESSAPYGQTNPSDGSYVCTLTGSRHEFDTVTIQPLELRGGPTAGYAVVAEQNGATARSVLDLFDERCRLEGVAVDRRPDGTAKVSLSNSRRTTAATSEG